MEDINHSCQIAGGARIDTRCGSPLKNSTIFSWQQFLLQGGHNHNKWPSLEWKWHNCILYRKKKKKGLQCGTIILDRATISRCTALIKQLILWPPQSNFYFPTMFTNSLLSPSAVRHTCREGSCTQTAISQLSWPLPSAWCEAHEPASQRA